MEETPHVPSHHDEIEELVKNNIQLITSYSTSPNRTYILITTQHGFVIVTLAKAHFQRFEDTRSPFYINHDLPCGAKMGSILESRTEVALAPQFTSKRYQSTAVYIFDYSIGIILSKFDFVLPLSRFSMTDRYLIGGNNKRILLYNYLKCAPQDSEQYYIDTYKSTQNIDFIKYLDLYCHLYSEKQPQTCQCGAYALTRTSRYLKLFYVRVVIVQNSQSRFLHLYDEETDRSRLFYEQKTWSDQFEFSVSEDGRYLAIAEDLGRKIKVFNLEQNRLWTVLHLSRDPGSIINLGVVVLPNSSEWVIASREKENDQATMHIFKLAESAPTDSIQSVFKRYFRLYKDCSRKGGIFADENAILGPEYYLLKEKLYCLSLQGEYCEIIDLNREGLHPKGVIKDYRRIEEV